MTDNEWFHAHVGPSEPDDAFRISLDVYPSQNLAVSHPAQTMALVSNTYDAAFPASNLPPSLFAIAEQLQSAEWPEFIQADDEIMAPSSEEEDFILPMDADPNSFLARMLRADQGQREKSVDEPEMDIVWPPRVDSAVGDLDDQASFMESDSMQSDPLCQIIAQEDDSAYGSMPLQYHLIQTRSQMTLNESFQTGQIRHGALQVPGSPCQEEENILYCELCDPPRPFTGHYAPRNRSRHMDQVHTPCTSSSGIKDFRCTVERCRRVYRRSDALLMHERRSHPELDRPPPVTRRSQEKNRL